MSRWIKNDRTNTIQLLVLIVGLVVLAYWATVSLTARDPLWFASEFEGQPSRFVVYHTG